MINKIIFLLILIFLFPFTVSAEQVALVLLSRGIIPYYQAVEGFEETMADFRIKKYNLDGEPNSIQKLSERIKEEDAELVLAVGPEAAYALKNVATISHRVFTMILNPKKVFEENASFPGVSMNFPPSTLLFTLQEAFPERRKIGIFYSPEMNADLVKQFTAEGIKTGMEIMPFPIYSSSEIQFTLQSNRFNPDVVLFIPDQVIIKEKLIHYIIEECLFKRIPTVGFNKWFARSGALIAFYVDYKDVGRQTGKLAHRILENETKSFEVEPPEVIKIMLNLKVAGKFDLKISEEIQARADERIE